MFERHILISEIPFYFYDFVVIFCGTVRMTVCHYTLRFLLRICWLIDNELWKKRENVMRKISTRTINKREKGEWNGKKIHERKYWLRLSYVNNFNDGRFWFKREVKGKNEREKL
jgi:hypothetical protein